MKHECYISYKIQLEPFSRSLFGTFQSRFQWMRIINMLGGCLLVITSLSSQTPAPGGVVNPKSWFISAISNEGQIIWKNVLTDQIIDQQEASEDHFINFNPTFSFEQPAAGLALPLTDLHLEKWTLFTTYQSRDTFTEKSIWSYTLNGQTKGILTTHRMADLEQFEYLNFSGERSTAPRINTYLHYQKENTTSKEIELILAQKPRAPTLPITSFTGKIPEIILYERVLAPEERQRVESYLAIKYGTNLAPSQQYNYLDARGRTLYAPAEAGDYIHRISGIGRDDRSGLYQKQSGSSYAPGLLAIGLGELARNNSTNTQTVPDQNFLLWADNDGSFDWQGKKVLQPPVLHRQWRIQATGSWQAVPTELRFDTHQLRTPAPAGTTYWLLVDRSGQGQFDGSRPVDYYPLDHLSASGQAHFREVLWDTDGSGRDVFTLATGPELMVQADLQAPRCFPKENGMLRLQAMGGRSPYHFLLIREGQIVREWTGDRGQFKEITDLPPGDYELYLTDADGKSFREPFYFQSTDAPQIHLRYYYQLAEGEPLHLDASLPTESDLQYEWQFPNGEIRKTPKLEISQPGTYRLWIERDGCASQRDINVAAAPSGNLRRVDLFPNPSTDGRFQARIHLEEMADLELRIFEPGGRQLLQRQLSGSAFYHTGEQLSGKGTYLLQFRSNNDQITIPLIVQ